MDLLNCMSIAAQIGIATEIPVLMTDVGLAHRMCACEFALLLSYHASYECYWNKGWNVMRFLCKGRPSLSLCPESRTFYCMMRSCHKGDEECYV